MWIPPLIGFLAGGVFLRALDLVLPHLHPDHKMEDAEGIKPAGNAACCSSLR
jgi:ZIP family zinc transporter